MRSAVVVIEAGFLFGAQYGDGALRP